MQISIKKKSLVDCGKLLELVVTKVIDILPAGVISNSGISMALQYSKIPEITEEAIKTFSSQINEEFLKIRLTEDENIEMFIHDDLIHDILVVYTNATNVFFNVAKRHLPLVSKVINVITSTFNFFKMTVGKISFDSAIEDAKRDFEEEIANEQTMVSKWTEFLIRK